MRHIQKLLFKLARQHIGAFDQGRHFIKQRLVFNGAHTTAHLRRRCLQLAHDVGTSFGKAGDHRPFSFQHIGIVIGMGQHHGRHFGFKAVPLGAVACAQAQRLHRHHRTAMQRYQAVRRAYKVHAGPARQLTVCLQLVLHDFGNRQLGQRLVQCFLQARLQRSALGDAVVKQGFGLAIGRALECGHGGSRIAQVGPQGLQFFQQSGAGVATGIQAHRHRHELLLHGFVSRLRGHSGYMRGQSAGRCKSRDARLGCGQSLCAQLLEQSTGK